MKRIVYILFPLLLVSCLSTSNIDSSLSTLDEAVNICISGLSRNLKTGTAIALLQFESPMENLSQYLIDDFNEKINKMELFIVLARNKDLEIVFAEQEFQLSGYVSDESSVSIGKILGAQSVITGSFDDLGRFYQLRLKVINVETGILEYSNSIRIKEEKYITDMLLSIGRKNNINIREDAVVYYNRGRDSMSQGNYTGAIDEFTKAINSSRRFTEAYRGRAVAYTIISEYDSAINDFTYYLNRNKAVAEVYSSRGLAYFFKKDYNNAIKDFNKSLLINNNLVSVYKWLGYSYYYTNDHINAIESFTRSISFDTSNEEIDEMYISRAMSYRYIGNNLAAINDYTNSINLNGNNERAYFGRAMVYFNDNNYLQAIDDFTRGLMINNNDYYAYLYRGNSYYLIKQYSESVNDLISAININNNKADAFIILGAVYGETREYQKAHDVIQRALAIDPNNKAANNLMTLIREYLNSL